MCYIESWLLPSQNIKMMSNGENHSCALDDQGAHCWGDNRFGQGQVPKGLKNIKLLNG